MLLVLQELIESNGIAESRERQKSMLFDPDQTKKGKSVGQR